ncbi:MAG TPA: phosphoesterase, partial [Planctomycetaceae bacterium]|nr:phosphoesterase [Planctomycetaceae bacterium]
MRLAWLTDIHLNFLNPGEKRRFLESLPDVADAVVITGDIAEGPTLPGCLRLIDRIVARPVFFVLGNHDFYGGSIAATRKLVERLARDSQHLVYLTAADVIPLTDSTALVGHDGWADGRLGRLRRSDVVLNDYVLITELAGCWHGEQLDVDRLAPILARLGDEAAQHLQRVVARAAAHHPQVIAATHVPPFGEAAWYEGRPCDENWVPHFASWAAG